VYFLCLLVVACGGGGHRGGGSVYYVSVDTGNDANSGGSPSQAKKTIQAAALLAGHGTEIRVAAGRYEISSDLGDFDRPEEIELRDGIRFRGGYDLDFSEPPDPEINHSLIVNMAAQNENKIFVSLTDVGPETLIEGFILDGGDSSGNSRVISLEKGSPTIQNNVIRGGFGSDPVGIWYDAGTVNVFNNTIERVRVGIVIKNTDPMGSSIVAGNTIIMRRDSVNRNNVLRAIELGQGDIQIMDNTFLAESEGSELGGGNIQTVYVNGGSGAEVNLTGNTIGAGVTTGAGNFTYGLYVNAGNLVAYNNVFFGGSGGATSSAIYIGSGSINLLNNTLHAGSGGSAYGLWINNSQSSFTVAVKSINNLFVAGDACVHKNGDAPSEFKNNGLSGCTTVYLDDDGGCVSNFDQDNNPHTCAIADVEKDQAIVNGAGGNTALQPVFLSYLGADGKLVTMQDNNWRLSVQSPAAIVEGGQDLSLFFDTDHDGQSRSALLNGDPPLLDADGWSLGAFEFQ